jgi:hypothetical protein
MIGFYEEILEPSKLVVRLLELRRRRGVARLKRRGEGFLFATSLTWILVVWTFDQWNATIICLATGFRTGEKHVSVHSNLSEKSKNTKVIERSGKGFSSNVTWVRRFM